MTEQERIKYLAKAATAEDFRALNEFQRRNKERYAAQLVYNFLRAYEQCNRHSYTGEINILDLRSAILNISHYANYEDFGTMGAPLAFLREQGREKEQATFSAYSAFISKESYKRRM